MQADRHKQLGQVSDAPVTSPQPKVSGKSLSHELAAGLRQLADRIEAQPEMISKAADLMSQDFMDNRAPPAEVRLLFLICLMCRVTCC